MPLKESDLYEYYFNYQIDNVERVYKSLSNHNISKDDILLYAAMISQKVFDEKTNITVKTLQNELDISYNVFEILRKAKILRFDPDNIVSVNFTHRRFLEFLVAGQLTEVEVNNLIYAIEDNSKWHDVLMLYTQITTSKKVNELIEYACNIMEQSLIGMQEGSTNEIFSETYNKAIHSLRFLTSAFSNNKYYITNFENKLENFINYLLKNANYINLKFAVDALPILNEKIAEKILHATLTKHQWLKNEAIEGCIYLVNLPKKILRTLVHHYTSVDISTYIKDYNNLRYLFSLTKTYDILKLYHTIKAIENIIKSSILFFMCIWFIIHKNIFVFGYLDLLVLCLIFIIICFRTKINDSIPFSSFVFILLLFLLTGFYVSYSNENATLYSILPNAILVATGLIFITPLTYYFLSFRTFKLKDLINDIKTNVRDYILMIGFCILIMILMLLLVLYIPYGEIILTILCCSPALFIFLTRFIFYINDRKVYKNIIVKNIVSRELITEKLLCFKTSYYRFRYLELLDNKKISVVGKWKNNTMPFSKKMTIQMLY